MLFKVTLLLFVTNVRCSRVVDSAYQAGIHLSDYCPNTDLCPEGSHVMCMYYNPHKKFGPKCRNARNITITPELANKLLDVSNAVRSKIARGDERGMNGIPLPRGYGIFRLKWDSELATFAQVLVNQCVLRHDQCRATKKFPNPSQLAALVRFSVPDWIPKNGFGNFTEVGFNNAKLLYAAAQVLKSWYKQKSAVTAQLLTIYPDWEQQPENQGGRLYMDMIYGPATHMGCGVSAYTEYAYYDNNTPLYYNSIHIICNFSAKPIAGGAVYNTVPPGDPTVLNPCGCPAGSVDDEDCLCHEELKEPYQPLNQKDERTCPNGMQCDPTVVLLPIFTVEDAPIDKLTDDSRKFGNASVAVNQDITDSLEFVDNNLSEFKHTLRTKIKIPEDTTPNTGKINAKPQRKKSHPKYTQIVKSRHFGPKQNEMGNRDEKRNDTEARKHGHLAKPSFFSKTPRFELPGAHVFSSIANKAKVVVRKDFSRPKNLVDKYLYRKENIVLPVKRDKTINSYTMVSDSNELRSVEVKHNDEIPRALQNPLVHDINNKNENGLLDAGLSLDTAEERLISDQEYLVNEFNPFPNVRKPEVKSVTEEADNKLMALLDTLEQEVKHTELRDDEKQVFDAKIRKIYGKVVGKPVDSIFRNNLGSESKSGDFGFHDIMEGHRSAKDNLDIFNHDTMFDDTNVEHIKELDKANRRKDLFGMVRPEEKIYNSKDFTKNQNSITKQPDSLNDYPPSRSLDNNNDRNVDDFKPFGLPKSYKTDYDVDAENKSYMRRSRDKIRQRNHNEIHSFERYSATNRKSDNGKEYLDRKSHRRDLLERQSKRQNVEKTKLRSNSKDIKSRNRNRYAAKEFQDDPLSIDRRKYYQDKLDSIQRNLKNVRRLNHNKDSTPRHMRAMRPSVQRSTNQMDSLYLPGRARILHGY